MLSLNQPRSKWGEILLLIGNGKTVSDKVS
jgi:hypothetical protein